MTDDLFRALRTESCVGFFARLDEQGGDLNKIGERGQTFLHEAISFAKPDIFCELIKRGASLNLKDKDGKSPLHYAATLKQPDMLLFLIAHGADVNGVDRHGNSPLWMVLLNPPIAYEAVEALLKAGADPDLKNKAGRSARDMSIMIDDTRLLGLLGNSS